MPAGGHVRSAPSKRPAPPGRRAPRASAPDPRGAGDRPAPPPTPADRETRKRATAEARRRERATADRHRRIADLESRIAEREQAIKEIEASMVTPGFYDDRGAAQPIIDRHQALMWEVGDLMQRWEMLVAVAGDEGAGGQLSASAKGPPRRRPLPDKEPQSEDDSVIAVPPHWPAASRTRSDCRPSAWQRQQARGLPVTPDVQPRSIRYPSGCVDCPNRQGRSVQQTGQLHY